MFKRSPYEGKFIHVNFPKDGVKQKIITDNTDYSYLIFKTDVNKAGLTVYYKEYYSYLLSFDVIDRNVWKIRLATFNYLPQFETNIFASNQEVVNEDAMFSVAKNFLENTIKDKNLWRYKYE